MYLPDEVVDRLRRHREAQKLDAAVYGPEWGTGAPYPDLVFTSAVGTGRDPNKVTKRVRALAVEAGVGHWTPHRLRHSCASLLVAAGVSLEVVSELLGHSSYAITADVYVHLKPASRQHAAEAMQGLLAPRGSLG